MCKACNVIHTHTHTTSNADNKRNERNENGKKKKEEDEPKRHWRRGVSRGGRENGKRKKYERKEDPTIVSMERRINGTIKGKQQQ